MLNSIMAAAVLAAASYSQPSLGTAFSQMTLPRLYEQGVESLGQRSYAPEAIGLSGPAPVGSGVLLSSPAAQVAVTGKVAYPGAYTYVPGTTLSHVLGAAGMFIRGASYDEILIFRRGSNSAAATYVLSWNIAWHRNVQLEPGDEVIVPDRSLVPL